MGRSLGVHYSGPMTLWRRNFMIVTRGIACTSGLDAKRIAADRARHSLDERAVTCIRCKRLLAEHHKTQAAFVAESKRIIAFARKLAREIEPPEGT